MKYDNVKDVSSGTGCSGRKARKSVQKRVRKIGKRRLMELAKRINKAMEKYDSGPTGNFERVYWNKQ